MSEKLLDYFEKEKKYDEIYFKYGGTKEELVKALILNS